MIFAHKTRFLATPLIDAVRGHSQLLISWLRYMAEYGHLTENQKHFIEDFRWAYQGLNEFRQLATIFARLMLMSHNGILDIVTICSWKQHCRDRGDPEAAEALLKHLPDKAGVLKDTKAAA